MKWPYRIDDAAPAWPFPGSRAGAYSRREDHRMAASTTDTIDTTKPISHPFESCEVMIAAITTPIPTIPPVATTRMSGASSGSRLRPLGIITPGRSAGASRRSLRAACRASRSASGCPSPLPEVVADMKPEYPHARRFEGAPRQLISPLVSVPGSR
jgi:hypothetical protein